MFRRSDVEWQHSAVDTEIEALVGLGATEVAILHKRIHDGSLRAIRAQEPPDHRWHLSVSHWRRTERRTQRQPRFPTWAEVADARYDLLPANIDVALFLPAAEALVRPSANTLHLWETRRTPEEAEEGMTDELHPSEEDGGRTGNG